MRAITAVPGRRGSVGVEDVPEPPKRDGALLVRGRLIGVCGTDREIAEGVYGEPPPGETRADHRARGSRRGARGAGRLGLRARRSGRRDRPPPGSGSVPGVRRGRVGHVPQRPVRRARDRPAPRVRQRAVARRTGLRAPDPARARRPGRAARAGVGAGQGVGPGRPDLRSGRSSSAAGRWSPAPARSGCWRACWACSAGYEVHVVDLATEGPKRDLVESLGAHYHAGDAADLDADVDVVIECTGLGAVGRAAGQKVVSGGIMCLTGIMNVGPAARRDATDVNRSMVLRNLVLFGTVNAGRRHWEQAVDALAAADPAWLRGDDHPPGAAHSLDRGAGPTAGRHQGRRRSRGMTEPQVTAWSDPTAGRAQRGAAMARGAPRAAVGRHPRPPGAPRHARAPTAASTGVTTIAIDRHVGAVAPAVGGRIRGRGGRRVPVRRRGRLGPGAGPARGAAGPTCG